MENREELESMLPFLPVLLRSSSLFWPPAAVEALKALARGPDHSKVDSGEVLFLAISDIRLSLNLAADPLASAAAHGYALFFDDLITRADAAKFFEEVLPALAKLLLRFPSLLETHYKNVGGVIDYGGRNGVKTFLRLLESQERGIVFLSQELIGALLACSFFCLFPITNRGAKHLPQINFDQLFASLYEIYNEKQEHKLMCIIHYFERICSCTPMGYVSFERKVLPLEHNSVGISYPKASFWRKSVTPLCPFEVYNSGLIEDQTNEALEVDFANKYIGGGALNRGCVQEEIRFMINPELIAGMLFLPSMADNEAIEIVGAERFSNYIGYASSFRFCGDYVDKRDVDYLGRRKTRIIAIDALITPGWRQYGHECLLRYEDLKEEVHESPPAPEQIMSDITGSFEENGSWSQVGIATGNWGCGAFGGDPEVKAVIQWLAASQALRPFIFYYTFSVEALQTLYQVTRWISSQRWTVGELWNMLAEYSTQRLKGKIEVGFFSWLLPSLAAHDSVILDRPRVT
ncbi:hypothetical protein RJ639_032922 [Escallonia herrerae]|uniref:poly(ADP-ribose) glycohydrolase n=1 Tax=Escallonia herrerae TaxID=1293975 RepID=A0AA88WXS6_9ASTE|nr:hypothetical protein RJ639_032922 [Escallonia herrerae]